MRKYVITLGVILIGLTGCGKQQLRDRAISFEASKEAKITIDSVSYAITFADSGRRTSFARALDSLLSTYRDAVVVRISRSQLLPCTSTAVPSSLPGEAAQSPHLPAIDSIRESQILPNASLRFYTPRGFVDDEFGALLRARGLCGEDESGDSSCFLQIVESTPRRISLRLQDLQSASGQRFSAFDIVNSWAELVKSNPAEGRALFRNVLGLESYIKGEEAIITGLRIADEKTIHLQLQKNDPDAVTRLKSKRLLPGSLGLGPYFIHENNGNEMRLYANSHWSGPKYLQTCALKTGKDRNPFVSFSLNQYDVMALWAASDLDYARRNLSASSNLTPFANDRYFLALRLDPMEARRTVWAGVAPLDLFKAANTEGRPISFIETDDSIPLPRSNGPFGGTGKDPVGILFRADDPVSEKIAERLLAQLAKTGLRGVLNKQGESGYQSALAGTFHGIVVGWVPASILSDKTEQLRLASIWFDDILDEKIRIEEMREIPLFSVSTYLLSKKAVAIASGDLARTYVKRP